MKKKMYYLLMVIFLLFASCSHDPCNKFIDSSLIKSVKKVVEGKKTSFKNDSNIIKVVFTKGVDNNKIYVTIRDDISYSEEANNFELDGYLLMDNNLIGFYNSSLYQNLFRECLIKSNPPKNYNHENFDPVSVNWWTFEILEDESIMLVSKGVNKNLKIDFTRSPKID